MTAFVTDTGKACVTKVSRMLCASALAVSTLFASANTADAATIVLDDFEAGFGGMNSQINFTGEGAPNPKPGRVAGLGISEVGAGVCDHLSGSSNALCGADTFKWGGSGGAFLSYAINFSTVNSILFDFAAFSDSDPFDHYNGENSNTWGDYLRVTSLINGTRSLIAEFTGVMTKDRTPETAYHLMSTDGGFALGSGLLIDGTFDTVNLSGIAGNLQGQGELMFEIRTTGGSEQVGIDNIRLSTVPLPGALSYSLAGLAAFGLTQQLRRRRKVVS